MRERRFLVPELVDESEPEIRGAEAHHLREVLRLKAGDEIVLFDGRGHSYRARLTRIDRRSARTERLEPLPALESPLALTLAVAVPKGEGLSHVVQKATELGASSIIPLLTDRTTVQSRRSIEGKLARWQRIAVEACKQCGRSAIPRIAEPLDFGELLRPGGDFEVRILLHADGGAIASSPVARSCLVAIGPEGGWSRPEVEAARAAGFHSWRLGPRTLRTETAAIAAVALLQSAWGDAS